VAVAGADGLPAAVAVTMLTGPHGRVRAAHRPGRLRLAADVRTFTTRWQPWPVSLLVRAHALLLLTAGPGM
jgi:hypothetical protein